METFRPDRKSIRCGQVSVAHPKEQFLSHEKLFHRAPPCLPQRYGFALLGILLLSGCDGSQSGLSPAGREAEQIANLFWWMVGGAILIWLGVIALAAYAIMVRPEIGQRRTNLFIIVGGAIFPAIVLCGLLVYGLWMLSGLVAPAPPGSLKIRVEGEQWWWRVRYHSANGEPVELANEIRLPVGETVEFELASSNVIHSFWIPSIGGKRDMIPGRVTRLALTPTRTGIFRGACAEYCGTSHAWMNFYVVVMEKDEFNRWLEQEANPAHEPIAAMAANGKDKVLSNGCGACHSIRGTEARGIIGPDLTHVGSRLSLGAGILTNEPDKLVRWISQVNKVKPGVHMPAFGMLPQEDLQAIAAYLEGLK